MDLTHLTRTITDLNNSLRGAAASSINRITTMRNWLTGMHIVEYEQKGEDRAQYGSDLLRRLSENLFQAGTRGYSPTNLRLFRKFYIEYQQFGPLFEIQKKAIGQEATDQLAGETVSPEISQMASTKPLPLQIQQLPTAELCNPLNSQSVTTNTTAPEKLLKHFSFTHFVELMRLEDPLKRTFYEIEGMAGCWSVPQLKRQIESLLYERTGMSKNKRELVNIAHKENKAATIDDVIRDPYILEFAGFPERSVYSESDLETALLDHVQSFLLELGNGFCFEARQKRITLDNEHDRIDLVFYHRILRCHVLIDLKVRKFRHGDAGQMNFYLNYYRENMMAEGDNPPVGLVLCTDRDETRVKYSITGMDNKLFVSKYLTALPSEEQIKAFLESDRDRTENVLREQADVEYR